VTGLTGIAGHSLQSCTSEVSVFRLRLPWHGLNLCFVDTPGFDDTNKSDLDILKLIAKWLSGTYVTINDFSALVMIDFHIAAAQADSGWLVYSTFIVYLIIEWREHP